jgi:hypothetical protein
MVVEERKSLRILPCDKVYIDAHFLLSGVRENRTQKWKQSKFSFYIQCNKQRSRAARVSWVGQRCHFKFENVRRSFAVCSRSLTGWGLLVTRQATWKPFKPGEPVPMAEIGSHKANQRSQSPTKHSSPFSEG